MLIYTGMEKVKKRTLEEGRKAFYESLTKEQKTERTRKMARARWDKEKLSTSKN